MADEPINNNLQQNPQQPEPDGDAPDTPIPAPQPLPPSIQRVTLSPLPDSSDADDDNDLDDAENDAPAITEYVVEREQRSAPRKPADPLIISATRVEEREVQAPLAAEPVSAPITQEVQPERVEPVEQVERRPVSETVARPKSEKPAKPSAPAFEKPAKIRKETYRLVAFVSGLRAIIVTFAAAVIVATIFMWWTSPEFLSAETRRELAPVQATAERINNQPTALPTPFWFNRIGIVAGHSGIATYGVTKGNVDPGTVCEDGFNEASVVMKVAQQSVALLRGRGFTVDLLEEFDPKLESYEAAAFVSLHADSCENFDDGFNHSGFKLSPPTERMTVREQDARLADCVRQNYGAVTGQPFAPGGITANMTQYHSFRLIAPKTPAIILEVGLLSYDRDLLENHTDKVAAGVVNGLLCYLQPAAQQPVSAQPIVPSPTPVIAVPAATATP